jgi:hypothetical protein
MSSHPPPPWRLSGRVLIAPALAATAGTPDPRSGSVARLGGRSLGGLMLARYELGSTLRYSELLAAGGVARTGLGVGFWIPYARVDDETSVAAGRRVWGLPKRMADFSWTESPNATAAQVTEESGAVVRVSATPRGRRWPVPVVVPFLSADGDRVAAARGWLHGARARVRVEVPPSSSLAELGLDFAGVGWVGQARLTVTSPRPGRPRPARRAQAAQP